MVVGPYGAKAGPKKTMTKKTSTIPTPIRPSARPTTALVRPTRREGWRLPTAAADVSATLMYEDGDSRQVQPRRRGDSSARTPLQSIGGSLARLGCLCH